MYCARPFRCTHFETISNFDPYFGWAGGVLRVDFNQHDYNCNDTVGVRYLHVMDVCLGGLLSGLYSGRCQQTGAKAPIAFYGHGVWSSLRTALDLNLAGACSGYTVARAYGSLCGYPVKRGADVCDSPAVRAPAPGTAWHPAASELPRPWWPGPLHLHK